MMAAVPIQFQLLVFYVCVCWIVIKLFVLLNRHKWFFIPFCWGLQNWDTRITLSRLCPLVTQKFRITASTCVEKNHWTMIECVASSLGPADAVDVCSMWRVPWGEAGRDRSWGVAGGVLTAPCRSPAWASSPPGGTPTHHPQPDVSHNTTPHVIIPPISSTSNVFFLKILQTVTFLCNKKSVISSALYFSNIMYSYFILIACAQQLPAVKLGVFFKLVNQVQTPVGWEYKSFSFCPWLCRSVAVSCECRAVCQPFYSTLLCDCVSCGLKLIWSACRACNSPVRHLV